MVKYLDYNNEKLPIRVSYSVMKNIQEIHGKGIDELSDKDISIYEDLLYFALESGYRATKKKMTWKKADMVDILDETFFQLIKLLPAFFQEGGGTATQMQTTVRKRNGI